MKSDVVDAIIEIPYRSRNKFEIKNGKIKLDRVLYSAMAYPAEYGFIDNTLAGDKDPLDILVIGTEPTYPGCIIPARVIGVLKIIDNGFEGEGIAKIDGYTIFIDGVIKGEKCRILIVKVTK